jgi:DNA-binding winged helix-turn-helix (wHTH) protein
MGSVGRAVSGPVYRFGVFELRVGTPALYRDGQPVTVTPKALATLTVLVSRHGTAVSKEELLATVWPDTAVEEASLSQNIYTLRKLLAKDFAGQSPIENIPRFGYRFALAVSEEAIADAVADGPQTVVAAEVDLAEPAGPTVTGRHLGRRLFWAVPLAAAAALAAFFFWQWPRLAWLSRQTPQYEATRFTSNSDEDRITAVGLSPDGKLVAYADADGIVLRGVQDVTMHFLPSPPMKTVQELSWFSDQLHLVLSGEDASTGEPQVWKISVLGEPPVLLRKEARLGVISHDGSSIAFTSADGSQVWVMGSSGEGAREVMQAGLGERFPVLLWTRRDDGLLLERRTSGAPRIALKPTHGDHLTYERVDLPSGRSTAVQTNFAMGDACLDSTGALIYTSVAPQAGQESTSL